MTFRDKKRGASPLALSRAMAPTLVVGAAVLFAGSARAQSVCLPAVGINIQCDGSGGTVDPAQPVLDLPAVRGPIVVSLGNGFRAPNTVDITTLGNAANVTINALGSAAINTVNQPGLVINSGGAINGQVSSIATQGNGATGAALTAADGVVFGVSDTVSTVGDNAPGIEAQGSSVAVTGNVIQTGGKNSDAVQLVSLNGPVNLDADALRTIGDLSSAAVLRSAGNVDVNVGVLQTQGSRALGLGISTNPAACVLLGNGRCDVTAAADQITTNGFGGIGALVTAATGVTTIKVAALQTNGDEAAGLDLSANPTVCATFGAGACDQNFTVGSLVTQGASSPGALVRAAGKITANVDVLRTRGADAVGLNLASDPDACVLLGKGKCGTSFNVGQLTTSGAGATGVLARVAGPTSGHVDVLSTSGDNAKGIDIAANPTVCALLGSGACDVGLTANQVSTRGNGAAAVLINAPGNVLANIGTIATGGNDAPGLSIITDPVVCLALGPGSCTVNATTTGPVSTIGDDSPGVGVTGGGDPITVATGPVVTGGNDSPGVGVTGRGPIRVRTGPVTTMGNKSPGVAVVGGDNPVVIDATGGAITTSGANSDGIDVATTSGDQTIVAGPVAVAGAGSGGIVAISPGCSSISITATGPVSSAQGTGIRASSACAVSVTTRPAAAVSGQTAGIDVTSGTGAAITIGDLISSGSGPAINANGASALVTVTPTGTIQGYVDLTDSDDQLVNNGRFDAVGDSAFGAGSDSFTNNGTLTIRPGLASAGSVTFTGLERFSNRGLVDLRNGAAGDILTLPGSFEGSGASTLGLDIQVGAASATADKLVIVGAATGHTAVLLSQLGANAGIAVNGIVVVDAGPGSAADAFTLGGDTNAGLVSYSLVFDPTGSDYALYGAPGTAAYELAKASEGARQIFYRTDDIWSGHMQSIRDSSAGSQRGRHGSALWGQMFGSIATSRSSQEVTAFGQNQRVVLNNRQDFFGGQIGYDLSGVSGPQGAVFGVTGGYTSSNLDFRANGDRLIYDAANAGVYASFAAGGFFVDGLAKYEHYWIKTDVAAAGPRQTLRGNGYGGKVQTGFRLGGDHFFLEPLASIEYARTSVDTFIDGPSTLDFDNATGLRGAAGARIGTDTTSGAIRTSLYAGANVVHEFKGRSGPSFLNNGQSFDVANSRIGTYGHGVIGMNIVSNDHISGFIEANGDVSKSYKGGGGRVGLSVHF